MLARAHTRADSARPSARKTSRSETYSMQDWTAKTLSDLRSLGSRKASSLVFERNVLETRGRGV
eukprot:1254195-Rhodomonas_salina.3